jgi:hypothetical protein
MTAAGKLTVTCTDFRPMRRNTLCGFAKVRINEMHLVIHDVAIHRKGDSRWAQLPAKPQITKDGKTVVRDGKTQYATILEFDSRDVRDAFSHRVIEAVLAFGPRALDVREDVQ